jgi:hypothetical protein
LRRDDSSAHFDFDSTLSFSPSPLEGEGRVRGALKFESSKKEIKYDGGLLLSRMLLAWNGKGI